MLYNSDTNIAITIQGDNVLKAGNNVEYIVTVYSSVGVTDVSGLSNKLSVINKSGSTVLNSSKISLNTYFCVEWPSSNSNNRYNRGSRRYRLKLEGNSVQNTAGNKNKETISTGVFTIDNTPPVIPNISLSSNTWKNQDIVVTITAESGVKIEYSYDTTTWQTYTTTITIDTNKTIYARAVDSVGNISGQSSSQVQQIK